MEGTEYFAAGLCFHLYLLPKRTKGFDVTVQLPRMTTDKNCSNFTYICINQQPYEQNTTY